MATGVASAATNRKNRALQTWLSSDPAEEVPTTQGTEARFWSFIRREFVPAMCGTRILLTALYGKIKDMHVRIREDVVVPGSYWHGQNKVALRSFATVSGLAFLTLLMLKKTQRHAHLIAPMLPVCWTDAVYGKSALGACIEELATQLMVACWTRGPLTSVFGYQYLGTHPWDEGNEFYPGSCHQLVQSGRHIHDPRYPLRVAEHHQNLEVDWTRDGETKKYVDWRRKGKELVYFYSCLHASHRQAHSREQHIIRERRPPTVELDSRTMVRKRGERQQRKRPMKGYRALKKRDEGQPKAPLRKDNMNISSHYKRLWGEEGGFHRPRAYNFESCYQALQRQDAALGRPMGPRDMLAPENAVLIAEWGATPGKRIDSLLPKCSPEQLCRIVVISERITGPYRKDLLQRRLRYLMPKVSAPKPWRYPVNIPDVMTHMKPAVAKIMQEL